MSSPLRSVPRLAVRPREDVLVAVGIGIAVASRATQSGTTTRTDGAARRARESLIVVASTRYEIGRHDATRWKLWNDNLRAIAAHPRNVVAANNAYDAECVSREHCRFRFVSVRPV